MPNVKTPLRTLLEKEYGDIKLPKTFASSGSKAPTATSKVIYASVRNHPAGRRK